jgi:mannose-6-phosphate isomerase-like protein (cupin superfamily)
VDNHLTVKALGQLPALEEAVLRSTTRCCRARLSLQMHRSEHWVVIAGTALVEMTLKSLRQEGHIWKKRHWD